MFWNRAKREMYPLVEKEFINLYTETIKEVIWNHINDYADALDKVVRENLTGQLIEINNDIIQQLSSSLIDSMDKEDIKTIELRDQFIKNMHEHLKTQSDQLTSNCLKFYKQDISQLINKKIEAHCDIDILAYEDLVKINCAVLETIKTTTDKNPNSDYAELINSLSYEIVVKKIFEDTQEAIKRMILEYYAEADFIISGIEEIKKYLHCIIQEKLSEYLQKETNLIHGIRQAAYEVLLEITGKLFTDKLSDLTSMGDTLLKLNSSNISIANEDKKLEEKHFEIKDGDKNITYEILFGAYLFGAKSVIVIEPYLQGFYQYENLLQLCKLLIKNGGVNKLHLITKYDKNRENFPIKEKLCDLEKSLMSHNIELTYKFSQIIHDREIICDNGWIIEIGRGLHIYQPPEKDDLSKFDTYFRQCRQTKVHIYKQENYIKEDQNRTKAA